MTDKEKANNNYRKAECCGNCKHFLVMEWDSGDFWCENENQSQNTSISIENICDLFEKRC